MDHLSKMFEQFDKEKSDSQIKGLCVICKEDALSKCYSEAGRREYQISGTCEQCFDKMFGEDEED